MIPRAPKRRKRKTVSKEPKLEFIAPAPPSAEFKAFASQVSPPPEPLFDSSERAALRVDPPMKPSEWAERNIVIKGGFRPGQLHLESWQRDALDQMIVPGLAQMNDEKANQGGLTMLAYIFILWCSANDPDPVGLAYPNKDLGRRKVREEVIPLFKETAAVRTLFTERSADLKAQSITLLNGFRLNLIWSGSAASAESDHYRRVVNDEVDLFDHPLGAIRKRLTTYEGRSLEWNISKPMFDADESQIHRLIFGTHEHPDTGSHLVLYWFVPCPFCQTYQRIQEANLRYDPKLKEIADKKERAAQVLRTNRVWFECEACHKHITPDHHRAIMDKGRWSTDEGYVLDADGVRHENAATVKRWPRGTRIGRKIWKAYWTWYEASDVREGRPTLTWASVLAEFIEAAGDRDASYLYQTGTKGEPPEKTLERLPRDLFESKCQRATTPEGIAPRWVARILAAVDTQKDYFFCVVRGYGGGGKSIRLWHGTPRSWAELEELLFHRRWPVTDLKTGEVLGTLPVHFSVIDSGGTRLEGEDVSRTMQVYTWAEPLMERVRVIKGDSHPKPGRWVFYGKGPIKRNASGEQEGEFKFPLAIINRDIFADQLAFDVKLGAPDLAAAAVADVAQAPSPVEVPFEPWLLNQRNDPVYNHHLSNMRKVPKPGGKHAYLPVQSGARIDYWHCEVYLEAAAYMFEINKLPPEEEIEAIRAEEAKRYRVAQAAPKGEKPDVEAKTEADLLGDDASRFL